MADQPLIIFIALVFFTVFFLSQVLVTPTFGTNRAESRKLKQRFGKVLSNSGETQQSIVKEKHLAQLSPIAKRIENFPIMQDLQLLLEQAGKNVFAYRFTLYLLSISIISALLVWKFFHHEIASFAVAFVILIGPIIWLRKQRGKYLDKFEEQLPEAMEMMARSLRTGYPFSECLKIIASEMEDPVSREFGLTFEEINYGRNVETAFALMINRVPSVSLIAMSTAILIQKETGGNLAEVLLKISAVLRSRFKLQRQVKTLSAEGKYAAWVLCLLPLVMFFLLNLVNPDHFKALFEHPNGIKLIYVIGTLEGIAILWIKRIINIDV